MIQPQFSFDPTQQFTLLSGKKLGATGGSFVTSDRVPAGVNRLIVLCSFAHNDANPIVSAWMTADNAEGTVSFGVPTDRSSNINTGELVSSTSPFLLPPGWTVSGVTLVALAAGKQFSITYAYLDYLIL